MPIVCEPLAAKLGPRNAYDAQFSLYYAVAASLLNDPDLTPEPGLASLPLTLDFGPVLGAMVARTGWSLGPNTADVVVEMKGGGYHFGNHQHAHFSGLKKVGELVGVRARDALVHVVDAPAASRTSEGRGHGSDKRTGREVLARAAFHVLSVLL